MIPPAERKCQCTAFEKSCRALVMSGECGRWMAIRGKDPATGADLDHWGCVEDHMPTLLLGIGKQVQDAAAETERLRKLIEDRAAPRRERIAHHEDLQ